MVGMAEIRVASADARSTAGSNGIRVLTALGLGSCIGICAYDRVARVAGLAHVVLPESPGSGTETPGKYADTAVPALVDEMMRAGALPQRVAIALVGGAQLFSFGGGASRLEIGARNASGVAEALARHRFQVAARDVGGSSGRTVQLFIHDGLVRVRTIGRGEVNLVCL